MSKELDRLREEALKAEEDLRVLKKQIHDLELAEESRDRRIDAISKEIFKFNSARWGPCRFLVSGEFPNYSYSVWVGDDKNAFASGYCRFLLDAFRRVAEAIVQEVKLSDHQ